MTIHIGAKKNQISDTVLLPGIITSKWAANKFLSNVSEVNTVRGIYWDVEKKQVTIHGSGMEYRFM